jgi:hypothetical protein
MRAQYFCQFRGRVGALRAMSPPPLNGIEYLEVAEGHKRLEVHFVHTVVSSPPLLTASNVEIRGGVRVRDPKVKRIEIQDEVLTVEVDRPGDFSRYLLRLVASASEDRPPQGIDPALAEVEFSFKADCPSEFDCRDDLICPPEPQPAAPIDYVAKDYTSFRRLALDRLSTLLPEWRERSPADLWITLAELLAFRADELSYFQDAVATEAYLGTARKRISVRRHARLLDYPFHDGCNARAWVAFTVEPAADGQRLAGCDPETGVEGTLLLTKVRGLARGRVDEDRARAALDAGEPQAFELLQDITLYAAHNEVSFHTWSDEECCLPRGATRAFLRSKTVSPDDPSTRLRLRPGDVLIFEERKSSANGEEADADRRHRHAVRLTRVDPEAEVVGGIRTVPPVRLDPVTKDRIVEIEWDREDALPFALCLSKRIGGQLVQDVSVALANVAPADHGRTVPADERLPGVRGSSRYRPLLERTAHVSLTRQGRVRLRGAETLAFVDPRAPAVAAFEWEIGDARAAIDLRDQSERWTVRGDLLASGRFSSEFVVEMEDDGRAYLRFGDGSNGRTPEVGDEFKVRYRIGNGAVGNVGSEAIAHVVAEFDGITGARNPLPARGGTDPHPVQQAKLYAPQAFRRQERAVTEDDYAEVTERHPEVQRAVATRRWTGSWYTMFITVDRRGGAAIDAAFEDELVGFLDRYRMAGYDVEVDAPRFVPLDIALEVCAKAGYFPADVKRRLLEEFSTGVLPAGGVGFFHPDNYTFISIGRLEIARLDNDSNAPENGRIEFAVHGEA